MGPDAATGLPQDGRGGGDGGPVVPGPASGRARGEGARPAAQQPDRRLAVDAGDGDDLVQELPLLGAGRAQVALALTAAYSRRLARVTGSSWLELVTVTSDLRALLR